MITTLVIGYLYSVYHVHAFVVPNKVFHTHSLISSKRFMKITTDRLDVVLFGIGDLRTDDHGGLKAAIEARDSKILPLAILDPGNLVNIPGAISSTLDTAAMVSSALLDLQSQLQTLNLNLKVTSSDMEAAIQEISSLSDNIHLHVCDLDSVDNRLNYGSYSRLQGMDLPDNIHLHSWSCHLRSKPWTDISIISDSHPTYALSYATGPAAKPFLSSIPVPQERSMLSEVSAVPSEDSIAATLKTTLGLNDERCAQERTCGLYGTHWGGLAFDSIGESKVLAALQAYADECGEDDEKWVAHVKYVGRHCTRNTKSLEHAAISWMMKGNGKKRTPDTQNLIAGESMTRYLTAPLMLGTLSPRRLWHAARKNDAIFPSVLQTISETREWHKILAARNIRTDPTYQGLGNIQYNYFRWQGFLCRYTKAVLTEKSKSGMLLVHGFGASGSQWTKVFQEMQGKVDAGLAPDLIGFGQSEKPSLTYTQYLWETYLMAFIKDVALNKEKWDTFVVGGNSIGGYTSMSVAADDRVDDNISVSSSGAPGTGRCIGLILMNSAGQIQQQEDVVAMRASGEKTQLRTVAEITSMDALPPCKPISRPIARVFGNGLLYYLRPRIQSICKNLYPTDPSSVDALLCDGILRDSLDPGAVNVMISGSKLPPPRTANELLGADFGSAFSENGIDSVKEGVWTGPVLVAQGMLDPLNDAKSRASMFRALRSGITISPINAGHCPHDELPSDVVDAIIRWKETTLSSCESQVLLSEMR